MAKETVRELAIQAPKFETAAFLIRGTAPYVQNKFSRKSKQELHDRHAAGSTAKTKKKREAKDFDENYQQAMYRTGDGKHGIPAPAFRNAMISACRTVNFKMTMGKLSVFVEADGFDHEDGTPLVLFSKGEPYYTEMAVRNADGGPDLRSRPMWDAGWEAVVRVRYDAAQFTLEDVSHLMMRVGMQVGVGEGRPDSKHSAGMGWGLFELVNKEDGSKRRK